MFEWYYNYSYTRKKIFIYFNVPPSPMMRDVPILPHVTSNKTYDFCMFYEFVNFVPIDLKIGTHIDRTYIMYHAKKCTNQNNVTHVSMATTYPIIKHRAFSKL